MSKFPVFKLNELALEWCKGQPFKKTDISAQGANWCIHYGELFTKYGVVIASSISKTNVQGKRVSVSGDILFPASDVTPTGLARCSALMQDNVILGGDIIIMRPRPGNDPRYLSYAINYQKEQILRRVTGALIKHLSSNALKSVVIPIPPLEKQIDLVEKLDKISTLIAHRNLQLQKLNQLASSRFIELFGDIIQNDKKWPVRQFNSIASSRLGKMLDAKKQTGQHRFPYLANCNVQWFHFDTNDLKEMDFNEADQQEFELRDGDLLVCEGGEIGRCAVWHNEIQPCYFQKAIHRVRCNLDIVLPDYLTWWFKISCEKNAFQNIVGAKATIAHLPGEKLKKLQVTVPPVGLQRDFTSFLNHLDKSKVTIQKSLEKLNLLYKALLQEYFG